MHEDRQDRDRWIASGMPDAVVTIMFRDGTLPPPSASRWYDSGLTTDEILDARRTGRPAPDPLGLPADADFLASWDGLSPAEILGAIDRGFVSADHYRPWAATDADASEVEPLADIATLDGFAPRDAVRQLRAGRTADEIRFAVESGIDAKKAMRWMERGMSAAEARSWKAAGFSSAKAAEWRQVTGDPHLARRLKALGFDAAGAASARPDAGWSPWEIRRHLAVRGGAPEWEIDRWADAELPDERLEVWIRAAVGPEAAEGWYAREIEPDEAREWAANDFTPDGAGAWRAAGIAPRVAARRRAAGVHPPAR